MQTTHNDIKKAIIRSQHCQRNYDLTKTIPEADIDLIHHAATQCPSKQNMAFYKLHFITNRDVIEQIHNLTTGFKNNTTGEVVTNSQVLSNLLIAFEKEDTVGRAVTEDKTARTDDLADIKKGISDSPNYERLTRDTEMAVGIAAGYINLTASILGYSTGCCVCMDEPEVRKLIGAKRPLKLLMGVGFKQEGVNRRQHPESDFVFPTNTKQEISVNFIK